MKHNCDFIFMAGVGEGSGELIYGSQGLNGKANNRARDEGRDQMFFLVYFPLGMSLQHIILQRQSAHLLVSFGI